MMLAEMEPISTAALQEKGMEPIFDWFERYQEYFYTLGWCYLGNQQQMEELFYRTILKVKKELPRYRGNPSFKMWATSIFIETSRDLANDRSLQDSEEMEPRQDVFKAIGQLQNGEKEALILTYVTGFSLEESAQILEVSADKMKELLFSGVQSVRRHLYGSDYNGCEKFQKHYINYLEKSMERPEKIEFEIHLYNCTECQEDLGSFQEVAMTRLNHVEGMNNLRVPPQLMENVKKRLADKKEHRQQRNKKRKKGALVVASALMFVMVIGFITGLFPNIYYAWTEDDVHLRAFLQEGFGERLNLEAESGGVKVKITGVVADDFQTLVFYEIHDMNEDKQYFMSYEDGLSVVNEFDIMNQEGYPRYSFPDVEAEMNKKEKNVFYGKVALRPLEEDQGLIKLKITKLQRLIDNASLSRGFTSGDYKAGDWSFEFPVTKQPSIEYVLNQQKEVEGIPIRLDKLTVAPTATILQYGIHTKKPEKRIDMINYESLEVNNKKVSADRYGSHFMNRQQDSDWAAFQSSFDPLYGVKPKEVSVHLESVYLTVEENLTIELGEAQVFPKTVEYAGSNIRIEQTITGQSAEIILSNDDLGNREYEALHIGFLDENYQQSNIMYVDTKSVLVDKNGVEYDTHSGPIDFEKLEQPRYFVTEQSFRIEDINETSMKLQIMGYNSMKYLDDVWDMGMVKVSEEK